MKTLYLILHLIIGATLSGSFVIVVLLAGQTSPVAMSVALVAGFIAAFPVAYLVARRMTGQ